MSDGRSVSCKLPNSPQVAGLPQQDVPVKASAGHHAEGVAVHEGRHAVGMQFGGAPDHPLGHIHDLDGGVQGAADQPQVWLP